MIVWVAGFTRVHAQQAPAAPQAPQASSVLAPVPRLMWFGGSFHPTNGLPPAPMENITIAVYREREGGDAIWRETQNVAIGADGRYSLLMGSTVPEGLPLEVFTSGAPLWIGVSVDRSGELEQPRVHFASVPYALKASDSDTLGGKPASAYVLADPPAASDASAAPSKTSSAESSTSSAGTANYLGVFVDSTNLGNSVLYQNGSLIGLGTTGPADAFHVAVNNGSGSATGYAVQNLSAAANAYSGMLFYDQNGALGQFQGFNNATHEYRINNIASLGSINFMVGSSSKFLVANSGNIGIGVAAPASKLDVAGDINTTTQYNIGGSRVLGVGGSTSQIIRSIPDMPELRSFCGSNGSRPVNNS